MTTIGGTLAATLVSFPLKAVLGVFGIVKKTMLHKEIIIVRSDGRRLPIGISTAILRDKDGEILGAVESFRDMSLVAELRRELKGQYTFEDIISKNPKMQLILKTLPQIAESGAGQGVRGAEAGTEAEKRQGQVKRWRPNRRALCTVLS